MSFHSAMASCISALSGDSLMEKCSNFCAIARSRVHCKRCQCRTCSFCTQRRSSPKLGHVRATGQLVDDRGIVSAVRKLNERWASGGGIALRVLECSIPCTASHLVKFGDLVRGREGGFRYSVSEKDCIAVEFGRKARPASLLRWDLPKAIFNSGRCVNPAPYEHSRFPHVSVITDYGYFDRGFIGHDVSAAGIGWVLGGPFRRRGGAFGHDAWTFNYRLSGTKHSAKLAERPPLAACRGAMKHSSTAYAAARLAARHMEFGEHAFGSPQQVAAAFKLGFANTSWNCYHPPNSWEDAFADQRAYAHLLAARGLSASGFLGDMCSIWGSLYNQVHVSWNISDVLAIFYVNDTLTASQSEQPATLAQHAGSAATNAFVNALTAQRVVHTQAGRLLPVIELPISDECYNARAYALRLQKSNKKAGVVYNGVFRVPRPITTHAIGHGAAASATANPTRRVRKVTRNLGLEGAGGRTGRG